MIVEEKSLVELAVLGLRLGISRPPSREGVIQDPTCQPMLACSEALTSLKVPDNRSPKRSCTGILNKYPIFIPRLEHNHFS